MNTLNNIAPLSSKHSCVRESERKKERERERGEGERHFYTKS